MVQTAYIKQSNDGWVNAKFKNGDINALPEYLEVELIKRDTRDYFTIKEGVYNGKKASIKNTGGSFIVKGLPPRTASVEIVFYRSRKILDIIGLGKFKAITYEDTPAPLGIHNIKIPDHPHALGASYVGTSTYAKTWFSLGNFTGVGDVYLHCGRVSLGCVTVTDIDKWDKIYNYLIKARLGHSDSVGQITVKG